MKWMTRGAGALLLALAVAAAGDEPPAQPTPPAPPAAPAAPAAPAPASKPEVRSWEVLDPAAFNAEAAAALEAGAAWPRSAVEVVVRRLGLGDELPRQLSLTWAGSGAENPSVLVVTAVTGGLLDDSIAGVWAEMQLEKQTNGVWRVVRDHRAWRCVRGGQTEHFDRIPCP